MGTKAILAACLSAVLVGLSTCSVVDSRCYPGLSCWPDQNEVGKFIRSLQGETYQPYDTAYHTANTYQHVRYHRNPALIVYVTGVSDIIKCVKFANKHNMLVTIKSSGHSYNGRSTHDGSLQINMSKMKWKRVTIASNRSEAGEITVETGNTWKEIYEEVQKYDRVVVGGSAHTVTPGGFTQGGGHSPISRSLGLAVDSLLEAQLVTADGRLVTARETETVVANEDADGATRVIPNGDLLWAIRGGGGGVWGVIINYTFRLHRQPRQMVTSTHYYSYIVNNNNDGNDEIPGKKILKDVFKQVLKLPSQWGGYVVFNNFKLPAPSRGHWGYVGVALNHFGEWTAPSRAEIDAFDKFQPGRVGAKKNKTSFWDYEKGAGGVTVVRSGQPDVRKYLVNGLFQSNTTDFDSWVDTFSEFSLKHKDLVGCTATLLGGKAKEENEATSVSPKLRSAVATVSCYTAWSDASDDDVNIELGKQLNADLLKYSDGVYYNEPAYDLDNWKEEFWGGNYDRLFAIKRQWDPDNFLWCHHCVGSDWVPEAKTITRQETVGGAVNTALAWSVLFLSCSFLFAFV